MSEKLTRRQRAEQAKRKRRRKRIAVVCVGLVALFALSFTLISYIGKPLADAEALPAPLPTPMSTPLPTPLVIPTFEPTPIPTPTPTPTPVPTPTPKPTPTYVPIVISAAGDCTLGSNANNSREREFASFAKAKGYDYFFENVRDIFNADDFTVVNFEGTLTTSRDKRPNREFNFRGAPEYVEILTSGGVDVCNLANNHSLDFGESGLKETAATITGAGIGVCGYTVSYTAEVKGAKVCFMGFTEWEYKPKEISKMIAKQRPNCDLLIASIHWGREAKYEPNSTQKSYGRAMIDAGADLVLGTHPHVVGGIERYKGKYILYSLGNFCFAGHVNPKDKDTMIFQQTFKVWSNGNVTDAGINIIPCSISSVSNTNDLKPTPMTGAAAQALLKKIAKYSDIENVLWMDEYIGNSA